MSWQREVEEIHRRRELARAQGGAEAIGRHHAKGELTVRERVGRALRPRHLPRARAHGGERLPRRGGEGEALHPRQLRGRGGRDRGSAGRGRRGGLHAPGRLAQRLGAAQEHLGRAPRAAATHPARAPARRGRGQRLEPRRGPAAPEDGGRAGVRAASLPGHRRRDGTGAGSLRGPRGGGGLPRRAPRRLALLGDGARHLAAHGRRPRPGGAGARPDDEQGGAGGRRGARAKRRGRQHRRRRA